MLERHRDFELREIPASKWICTKGETVVANDPFDGWQKKFDGDPFEVMAMPEWKRKEDTIMFLTLLSYIQGVLDLKP